MSVQKIMIIICKGITVYHPWIWKQKERKEGLWNESGNNYCNNYCWAPPKLEVHLKLLSPCMSYVAIGIVSFSTGRSNNKGSLMNANRILQPQNINFVICCTIHVVYVVAQFYPWFECFVCLGCDGVSNSKK